jgi:DNA polymerase III delta prime subunit
MALDIKTDELLWVQKYRPQRVADSILPEITKKSFQKFVDDKNIPNLLLTGSPGTGKTTVAKAMLEELGCDYIVLNAALNRGIDLVRSEISTFASSISLTGGRKYIVLDESDYLTPEAQASMRNLIETFSKNCGFIFTCNFKNRIITPLRSRLSEVDFAIEKTEKPKLAAQFFKRTLAILKNEEVEFDQKVVAKVIEKHFPDFRRILNELQKYAGNGTIDEGIFVDFKQESLDALFDLLKSKNFTEMRKWCADNSDQDANELFRKIYDMSTDKIELKSMPAFVVTLADYMYKSSFVADQEINLVAFLTEIMMEAQFR